MNNAASGWLMIGLNADPFILSSVQVASTVLMFLFALGAGALADIVDKRRLLIIGETSITLFSALFAALVWLHLVTSRNVYENSGRHATLDASNHENERTAECEDPSHKRWSLPCQR